MSAPGSIWQVETWPLGWTVRHIAETGSTNADLLAALEAGTVGDRTALVAAHQTAGRGRLDRTWQAPSGANLLVSLGFTEVPTDPALLTQRVGVATLDACRAVLRTVGGLAVGGMAPGGVRTPTLKWPNDVLLDDAKVAGILAQRSASTGAVVVGVGLNVGWAPDGASCLLGPTPSGTVDDADCAAVPPPVAVSVAQVLRTLLEAFEALPVDCSDRYRSDLGTIGRDVNVELPNGSTLLGRAIDVDGTGRLVVQDRDGVAHHLDVGDVVHARHAG